MNILSIAVTRDNRNLSYTQNNQLESFRPVLNPKKYPKFCIELLAEFLLKKECGRSFEIRYITPSEWTIEIHRS